MGREKAPLIRNEGKRKNEVTINISDIFRNPDIQEQVIKSIKKIK